MEKEMEAQKLENEKQVKAAQQKLKDEEDRLRR